MTVDYDTPRRTRVDGRDDPVDELAGLRSTAPGTPASGGILGIDDGDPVDSYDLPDADLSGEELMVAVIPKQADEFTCRSCFLVHHRSRLARGRDGAQICTDCA